MRGRRTRQTRRRVRRDRRDVRCGVGGRGVGARAIGNASARGEDAVDEFRLASADALPPRAKERLEFGDGERGRVGGFARGFVRGERAGARPRWKEEGTRRRRGDCGPAGVGDASKRAARVPGMMMMLMPRRSRSAVDAGVRAGRGERGGGTRGWARGDARASGGAERAGRRARRELRHPARQPRVGRGVVRFVGGRSSRATTSDEAVTTTVARRGERRRRVTRERGDGDGALGSKNLQQHCTSSPRSPARHASRRRGMPVWTTLARSSPLDDQRALVSGR